MGWFDGRKRMCFDVPAEQHDIINLIIEAAERENPKFNRDDFFSEILSYWIDNHWRDLIRKIAYKGKARKKKR